MKQARSALLISVLIWASTYAFNKMGMIEIPPVSLAFFRFAIASVALLIFVLVSKRSQKLWNALKDDWFYFLMIGTFGIALMHIPENLALKMTSTSETAIIMNSDPLLIAMLSYVFLRERLTNMKMVGLLIGFVGVTVVILRGEDIYSYLRSQSFMGNVLAFSSSCAWAIYVVMCKKRIKKYGPIILTTGASVFGALVLGIFAYVLEPVPNMLALSLNSLMILAYLSLIVSVGNYLLWNYALKHFSAANIGSYWFLVPIIATIIGVGFFKEQLTVSMIAGGLLILIGIYLMEGPEKKINWHIFS